VDTPLPAISKLLTHDDRWHRIQAAITLWKIDRRSSVSVPPLMNMLADTKLAVRNRAMAAEGLGIIGPQASGAKATLFAAMGEKQSRLLVSAAWALWKTTGDSKSTRPVLLDLLKDDNLNVFSIAAKTLGEMGWDKESLVALVAAVEADSDRTFSMRRLTQKLVEALISHDVEIRKEAIVALSKIGKPEKLVRDALKKALEDKDPEERAQAEEALKNLRSDNGKPVDQ
jgi:HEAT repeat protein